MKSNLPNRPAFARSCTSIPSQLAFRISRIGVSHGNFGATVANAKTANASNPKFELQCSTSDASQSSRRPETGRLAPFRYG